MPKLVVFGGRGFVGSHIVQEALNTGLHVVAISRSGGFISVWKVTVGVAWMVKAQGEGWLSMAREVGRHQASGIPACKCNFKLGARGVGGFMHMTRHCCTRT